MGFDPRLPPPPPDLELVTGVVEVDEALQRTLWAEKEGTEGGEEGGVRREGEEEIYISIQDECECDLDLFATLVVLLIEVQTSKQQQTHTHTHTPRTHLTNNAPTPCAPHTPHTPHN